MEYKVFKDIKLSRLGMGNMRLPMLEDKSIDYVTGQRMIDDCMEAGINYYDTAFIYHNGESEVFLGKALSKYPRESYYLADKFKYSAEPDCAKQFNKQLERLNTDYIDFYLIHGIADNNIDNYIKSGCFEYFSDLKEKGIIKYLGFSFHGTPSVLKRALDMREWDFVQIQFNYYDYYHGSAKDQYNMLKEKNIPIMVMEPVHGGMLANLTEETGALLKQYDENASYASWALRFAMEFDQLFVILSGMSNEDQLKDNIHTFNEGKPLNEEQRATIRKISDILCEEVGVPCTNCRYCVDHCPKGILIPDLLKIYNEYKTDAAGAWRLARLKNSDSLMNPAECISCGLCTRQCPQNIEVKKYLKEMTEDMQ